MLLAFLTGVAQPVCSKALRTQHQQESATWDGSLDFGEQLGASYMAASEAVEREPDLPGSGELGAGGDDAAAALGSRVAGLPGLPSGRRVSLLAGWAARGLVLIALCCSCV